MELNIQAQEPVDVQIERQLRAMIEQGRLTPGEKLPSVGEMASRWRVGRNSIGKAMKRLVADGLVECSPKLGSFVRKSATRAVIGILVGDSLADEHSSFCRAIYRRLRNEIEMDDGRNWICRVYDNLSAIRTTGEMRSSAAYHNFIWDLKNYGFKGIIKLYGGLDKEEEAFALNKTLPRARLGVDPQNSDLILDFGDFTRESVRHLASRGVRRIVYLRTLLSLREGVSDIEGIADAVKSAEGKMDVHTIQLSETSIDAERSQALAYEKLSSFLDGNPPDGRPDAFLISDDIAAKGAVKALLEKGVRSTGRTHVMVMANAGASYDYGMPVVKYEFSPERIADLLIDVLRKRILDAPLPPLPLKITGTISEPS